MTWYFTKQAGGFLTTLICGERTLQIPDRNRQRDPKSKSVDKLNPSIKVDNPDCTLPPDDQLWPLTDAEYAELIRGQEQGKVIVSDERGFPILQDKPPQLLEQIKNQQTADLAQRINTASAHKTKIAERIATLNDAVANMQQPGLQAFAATAEEQDELRRKQLALVQWKNYAIALGRITPTGDSIEWPEMPEDQ